MAELTFREAYRTHGFVVEIEGTQCPVTKVTGLNEGMTEVVEQIDGGSTVVRKIAAGPVKFDNLVLEYNLTGGPTDQFFKAWFDEMFQLNGVSGGSSTRHNGAILKLENQEEVFRFAFYEGWIVSSKFSDLEAGSNGLFKHTVEIAHNGLERVV